MSGFSASLATIFVAAAIATGCSSTAPSARDLEELQRADIERLSQQDIDAQPELESENQKYDSRQKALIEDAQSSINYDPENFMAGASEAQKNGDTQTMLGMLEIAANGGVAEAHYQLGKHYAQGLITKKDLPKSLEHISQAARQGHHEALRVLGRMYLQGNQVPQDTAQGEALLDLASEQSVRAMRESGLLYLGVYKPDLGNPEKGVSLLERASLAGDVDSMKELQRFFERKGDKAAAEEIAAKLSLTQTDAANPPAKDEITHAEKSTEERAISGDADAMYELANKFLLKRISSKDSELEAYIWFVLAAEYGNQQAKIEVDALDGARASSERAHPGRYDQMLNDARVRIAR